MQLTRVNSGTIEAIGYDNLTQELHILFKDQTYYKYSNVPIGVHTTLMQSPSKGSVISKIAKMYKGVKQ